MTSAEEQVSGSRAPIPGASPNTLVLLGAGASVDAGVPTSEELQKQLCRDLPPLYRHLSDLIFPTENDTADPERVFRALAFLHALETEGRPVDRRDVVESLDVARLVGSWRPDIAEFLAAEDHTVAGSITGEVIDSLWDELRNKLWIPPLPTRTSLHYLVDLVSAMRGQTVVTLNYDNALDCVGHFCLALGFDDGPTPRDWGAALPGQSRDNTLRIVRLHGSLAWRRDRASGDVRPATYDELVALSVDGYRSWNGDTPGIIFGAGNKLRADGPYLDLYAELRRELANTKQLIIIGYSFRDEHVNEALRRWFENAEPSSVLRINWMGDYLPTVVQDWQNKRDDIRIQMVTGTAAKCMRKLVAPIPRLAAP